jgi:flagellar motor switch protein FliM
MAKTLTQAEIDAMFGGGAGESVAAADDVQDYSFATQRSLSSEQTQEIGDISERFARGVASSLSAWLKADVVVLLGSVERAAYGDFMDAMSEGGAYFSSVQFEAVTAMSLLQLDMQLGYCILDLLLGGAGKPSLNTDLTHVDEQLFQAVMTFICDELTTTWRGIGLVAMLRDRIMHTHINRLIPSDEQVLCLTFEMRVGATQGNLVLTLPAAVSSFLLRQLAGTWKGRREHPPAVRERLLHLSKKMMCQLTLQLPPSRLRFEEVSKLALGQLIEFKLKESVVPQMMLSGRPLFEATAVSKGNSRAALLKLKIPDE